MRSLSLLAAVVASGCWSHHLAEGTDPPAPPPPIDAGPRADTGPATPPPEDAGSDAGADAFVPPACPPPEARACPVAPRVDVIEVEPALGAETVVTAVEVLPDGTAVALTYDGLVRVAPDGALAVRALPEELDHSFPSLLADGSTLWATGHDHVGRSDDGGDSWEIWAPGERDMQLLRVDGEILVGADNLVGRLDATNAWRFTEIESLDGDTDLGGGDYWFEVNVVTSALATDDGVLLAERFGRVALAPPLSEWGPWTVEPLEVVLDTMPRPFRSDTASPELRYLDGVGVVAITEGGNVHRRCESGAWTRLGSIGAEVPFATHGDDWLEIDERLVAASDDGLAYSCDRGRSWRRTPLPGDEDAISDLAAGPDGSVWMAGHDVLMRATF